MNSRTLALAAVVLAIAPSALAAKPEQLRLRAFAVDLNAGTRTRTVDIVIERWSTPDEYEKLRTILVEKGGDQLLSALQKTKPRCGFARTSNSLGWDLYYCRQTETPGAGRRIVLATDRPVSMWEAANAGRSMDYEFSLAEIHLGPNGKGEGKAIPRAKLSWDKEKDTLEIENYEREPVRLNEVTVVEPKKKQQP